MIGGLGAALLAPPAYAQAPAAPAAPRTTQHQVLLQAHLLTGRHPNASPDPETYYAAGATAAYRRRWREAHADYDTDLTLGARLGLGQLTRPEYFPTQRRPSRPLRAVNVFAAADGRYFGAALGAWLGRLGYFRGGENRAARALPQVRVRAGRLDGPHAQIDYADEFGGFGNPPLRVGGGLGFVGPPLTLRAGAAIPTLAATGSEVQVFGQAQLRLGRAFEARAYYQPRFSSAAPTQLALAVGYVP